MAKHHLIISGTGRAGTTFLMQLFTELGLDTGFSNANTDVNLNSNAGMEWNIRNANAPYIVKSPAMDKDLEALLPGGEIAVDCAIIPIRDLYAAAESRRAVQRNLRQRNLPGGLVLTENPEEQEAALAVAFHRLVHTLAKHDVPMIWLHFPRLVNDSAYLYGKIKSLLPDHDLESFSRAFRAVSRPHLVHAFEAKTAAEKPAPRGLKTWFRK
ncbi:MAG TPA: hypothetical protein VL970_03510 [Candidatus Acidoferrales bacterium]|nr:hypothetical protein [Candidatus Acidoferrales bacterium]